NTERCSMTRPLPALPTLRSSDLAETRAMRERLYEVTQMKGDSESHPFLSPNDEFANYERWDKGNLDLSEKKNPEMLEFEYARGADRKSTRLNSSQGRISYAVLRR